MLGTGGCGPGRSCKSRESEYRCVWENGAGGITPNHAALQDGEKRAVLKQILRKFVAGSATLGGVCSGTCHPVHNPNLSLFRLVLRTQEGCLLRLVLDWFRREDRLRLALHREYRFAVEAPNIAVIPVDEDCSP